MIGITNDIPKRVEKYELHRLIGTLFSNELNIQEKLDIIEQEYNIPVNKEFREDVNIMCNLSTGIEERAAEKAAEKAIEETNEKFIMRMYKKGYTLEQIVDVVEMNIEVVKEIINKN